MIDVGKFERMVADLSDEGAQLAKAALLDIANELRLGNAARLRLAADAPIAEDA